MMTIRVNALDYAFTLSPQMDDWGRCDSRGAQIHIHPDLDPAQSFSTAWHEIIHAMIAQSGVTLKDEELVADLVGSGVAQVLRDNPGMRTADVYASTFLEANT